MHLKSIEMVGFKSFADKTFVELKEGVSAVVGPNGCGKSNIVDAVRWSLGEMSPRSLRSKQMADVIFAGAAGRAQMNMAEVTMTFDNSSHLLPTDFTEVQVTRRLFRSGESEYYLNKTQCRLKDIRDLFLDTGLSEGYSILAQGEVDFVINAKPEERRELFEEAAGISKYKSRREESLRKLEKVELDIQRLNDIIAMVKEQMDSLEAAVKKAKLFQKLKEELKSLEVTDALNQISKLDEQLATTKSRMAELEQQIQQYTTNLDCTEAKLTQNRVEADSCDKQLYELNRQNFEVGNQINASDHAIKRAQETEQHFAELQKKCGEQIQTAQEKLTQLASKQEEIQKELASAEATTSDLKQTAEQQKEVWRSAEKERKEIENAHQSLSNVITDLAVELNEQQNQKNAQVSSQFHLQADIAVAKKSLAKRIVEEARLTQELDQLQTSNQSIESSLDAAENEISNLKNKLRELENRSTEIAQRNQVLKVSIAQKEAQSKALEESFENNSYKKGTQAVVKQNFPGFRGIVGLIFKYPENRAQWIESALGRKISYLVFDRLSNAQKALQWLKDQGLGRATCLIMDKIPQGRVPDLSSIPNANSLLSFVQCDPEFETLKNYLLGSAFIAGNTLYDASTIDGGSDFESRETPMASSQNQFLLRQNLSVETDQMKEELRILDEELTAKNAEIITIKTALAEKEKLFQKNILLKDHSKETAAIKNQELQICREEMELDRKQCEQNEKALQDLESAAAQIQTKLTALQETQKQKETERRDFETRIAEKRETEHQLNLKAQNAALQLEYQEKRLGSVRESFSEVQSAIIENQKILEQTTSEIETSKQKIEESQKIQSEESRKVQELEQQKNTLSNTIEEFLQQKSRLDQEHVDLQNGVRTIRESRDEFSRFLREAEMDGRTIENEKKNILQRMEENYQLTLEQALAQQVEQKAVSPEEILRLKKRVESMGNSVNLEAPEQHQQLQERYNFLTSQTQDLTTAREDLKNAIKQINTTTKEQFKETFEKVRENFKQVYGTLFEGGQADLIFTNEQDLLETGIDIVVQPAGKKLQNITLLSGGEKALTAIALLFAFFLVKPSPFCILDEVDAPWDPANVSRFLKLLETFSAKTQFLIVTHNPRTMEIADILFGITMEEFGVSKILTAKLKKETAKNTELAPA